MKRMRFKKVQNQLVYWFMLLSITPLVIIITVTYFQRVKVIEERTYDKLLAIRDLKVEQLSNWIAEREGDINAVSGDFEIRGLEFIFEKDVKTTQDFQKIEVGRELLTRYLKSYKDYSEITFISANSGLVEISTSVENEKINNSHERFFTVPMETGKIYMNDIYHSNITGKDEMTFSTPVYCLSHNVHIIGVVVLRIDLDKSLYKLLENRVGLGETGETLIVNKDMMALNKLRWYENAPLHLKINAAPALKASQGETGIVKALDYAGNEVLAAYAHIPQTGWGFVAKQNMYELNAPIRQMIWNFIFLFSISVIVIIIVAIVIGKRISKPIVALSKVAQLIKSGDFTARILFQDETEIGILAEEFNNMAEVTQSRMKVQQSMAEITDSMIGQTSMELFGESLIKTLMRITDANMCTFYILNEGTMQYEHFVSVGANAEMLQPFSVENPQGELGNIFATKEILYLNDIPESTIFKFKTTAGDIIPKEIITIPIFVENTIVGFISLVNIKKFDKDCLEILKQSWVSINTSYSSLLASERTRVLAEHLSKINQQLEAQSEELQEQSEELQEQAEELQSTSDELQEQNLKLHEQSQLVEMANKLKSEFLSNMSHELRTPLNSILALSRVLIMQAKNKLDDEENNYLEIVERNGKNLLQLINNILDLSKIESGKMDVIVQTISLKSMLLNVRENMFPVAQQNGLELIVEIPDDLPKIETDEMKLNQVITNVVANAIKFTLKGSVIISASYNFENVFVEIKDTGIGISEEVLPYIFDEFRQADGSTSRQYQGTGLGLAIAKKMTTLLGGDISVESKIGAGSVFTVSFPIKWHEKQNTFSDSYKELPFSYFQDQSKQKHSVSSVDPNKEKACILIVEDNPEALIQVKTVLEKEKYTVEMANSGKETIEFLNRKIPDGIILDLMMPEMDGFEVLEKIRGMEKTKDIPVLILTAKDLTQSDLARLNLNRVQHLVHKGEIDINGLLNKVNQMLLNEPEHVEENSPFLYERENGQAKVLIIEDNPDNLTAINAILQGKYQIFDAANIEIGLLKVKKNKPDIVLLDISIPGSVGEEYVRNLKQNKTMFNIPIIAVTAQAMAGDKERFIRAGCDGYVSKPIEQELLITEIERLIIRN